MYRIITQLLIIVVLAINVAWAGDSCFISPAGDTTVLTQIDSGQESGACDDFCVGWLHLVSLSPNATLGIFSSVRQTLVWTDASFDSREREPPVRPPQI